MPVSGSLTLRSLRLSATFLVATFRFACPRYGWLLASIAWLSVLPRALVYDHSVLAVAGVDVQDQRRLNHEPQDRARIDRPAAHRAP